jgi:cytidylate kinase
MYRAVTWVALQRGVPLEEASLSLLVDQIEIDVRPPSQSDGRSSDVLADGEDITWEIRRPEVDANVSVVSASAHVRQALTPQQRRIGLRGNVVMVGRDIGTVVLPDAELKLFLDASVEERARRRFEENRERGQAADFETILQAMRRRDQIDSTRLIAPLRPAADAIILNSDGLDADQVFARAKALVLQHTATD